MSDLAVKTDLETLLAPIQGPSPAGVSLRYDRTYDLIREARREDDPSLPLGDWGRKLKVADFAQVARLTSEALATRSKDLRLAGWLGEAWIRTSGIGGATRGLDLVASLVTRYWETAFPSLEEDGIEARVDLVEWMDDVFALAIRRTPLGDRGQQTFTYEDWERAEKAPASPPPEESEPPPTREALFGRASFFGEARWRTVRASVNDVTQAVERLRAALAEHMPHPPVLHKLREVLGGLGRLAQQFTGGSDMLLPPSEAPPPDALVPDPSKAAARADLDAPAVPRGAIRDRVDAYQRLAEAADYLLRTEPHSPVPYLVKRAIGWGNMSLAELLVELVGNADDLVAVQRLLGMRGRE